MAKRLDGRAVTNLRSWWAPKVAAGVCVCRRCDKQLWPNAALPNDGWDLGHLHDIALGGDPRGPMVPEHTSCNRGAGARLGLELRRHPRRRAGEWLR